MGSCCCCITRLRGLPLLFLSFLICHTQLRLPAEGRIVPERLHFARMEAGETVMVRTLIGSRPPRCESVCAGCGHCEAVQVPAVPQDKTGHLNSREGDDGSNYKPVSWKCKCGDMIMNP